MSPITRRGFVCTAGALAATLAVSGGAGAAQSVPAAKEASKLPPFRLGIVTYMIAADWDAAGSRRLAAYWAARNRFIEVGQGVRPSADPQRMLSQVREPLLSVLRTSPDFRPAYDPLLRMATALARTDPAGARSLMTALIQVQPARPEAEQALAAVAAMPR